jgi:hypothetical protein
MSLLSDEEIIARDITQSDLDIARTLDGVI